MRIKSLSFSRERANQVNQFCYFLLVGMVFLFGGCVSAEKVVIPDVATIEPVKFKGRQKGNVFMLTKVLSDLKRGQIFGVGRFQCLINTACVQSRELKWSGKIDLTTDELLKNFQNEFREYDYPVYQESQELFSVNSSNSLDFQIGAKIVDYKLDYNLEFGYVSASYLKVLWQVFSTVDKKVVFETHTEGSVLDQYISVSEVFMLTFTSSIKNLMGDKKFNQFIINAGSGKNA